MSAPTGVIVCGPASNCGDPHPHRWYCMRGHTLDDEPATAGVCHLERCLRVRTLTAHPSSNDDTRSRP